MHTTKITLYFAVSIFVLTIASSAYALKFTGDAWVAQHIEDGNPTDEYFLVINESDIQRVKLQGIKFKKSPVERDFSQLTNQEENEGITYYQINTNKSKKFKNIEKKARKKSKRLIQKGRMAKEDRHDWMDEWIAGKLDDQLFNLAFKSDGNKYKGRIGFATFDNPFEEDGYYNWDDVEGGADSTPAPVPEPGTMILLSTGLLGLAGVRRRFKK